MSIAGDLIRGHTDAIILARLLRGDSYGYEINKTISTLSCGRFELKGCDQLLREWQETKEIMNRLLEVEEEICGNSSPNM